MLANQDTMTRELDNMTGGSAGRKMMIKQEDEQAEI
jgi:hypothetical protein